MTVPEVQPHDKLLGHSSKCHIRPDDIGWWNICKAWYWYPLHLASCVGFVVLMLVAIDEHDFLTGSPPSLSAREHGFYQTEVNGFISAILVLIRLIASCSAGLLIWRLIYILLEKSGLTIAELCRMADMKIPIVPRLTSRDQLLWSCFAVIVTLLLWPPIVAAPLANSALSWIPSTRIGPQPGQSFNLSTFTGTTDNLNGFMYDHIITPAILQASLMISQDPDYAFIAARESRVPLKRYIYGASPHLYDHGTGEMILPYFKVESIRWLDAPEGVDLTNLNKASPLKQNPSPQDFPSAGTLGFFTQNKWNFTKAMPLYKASKSMTFEGKRNVSIFVGGAHGGNQRTPCPTEGDLLGQLPAVKQYSVDIGGNDSNGVWTYKNKRCYMLAEVSMKAGAYRNRRVNITRVGSSNKMSMAVPLDPPDVKPTLSPDESILPVLDMMSDVARLTTYMDLTPQWQKNNTIDNYVTGMLTTAYHATWSAMPMSKANETVSIVPMQSVIRAKISRSRLYVWLGLNSTLVVAAVIMAIALNIFGKVKVVRNTTLAAVTLDLGRIAHRNNSGLCNAVELNKDDHALGRLKWRDDVHVASHCLSGESYSEPCCKELIPVRDEVDM